MRSQFFALASFFLFPIIVESQCLQTNLELPEVNGSINTIKTSVSGDTLFAVGNFTDISPKVTGSLATFSRTNFSFQDLMPVFGNTVNAIASDGNGGWYVAGKFVKVHPGIDRYYVARVNANGSLHPFSINVDGEVKSIQFTGDRLFLGGGFTNVNGQSRNFLAAVDTNGALLNWAPNLNNAVQKIVYKSNKVFVAGDFTLVGGLPKQRIAVFDTFNSVPNFFNANINGTVLDIEVDDSLIYLSGSFTTVNSTSRNYLAVFRLANGSLHPFNANINGYAVNDILLCNNKLFIAGSITSVGLQIRTGIAIVNRISGSVLGSNLNVSNGQTGSGTGSFLFKYDSLIFFGGDFKYINGIVRRNFACLDTGTFILSNWQANFNHAPLAVGVNNNVILIGGSFNAIQTIEKRGFFAFRLSTHEVLFDGVNFSGTNVEINDINFYGNKIIFGGVFDTINGVYRKNICMVSFSGIVDSWNLPADNSIKKIEIKDQLIFVAGSFANIGGLARAKFAVLDANTSSVINFIPNPNGVVNEILLCGNRLFVAGGFTTINGFSRTKIASFTLSGGSITIDPWSVVLANSHSLKKLIYFNNRIYALSDSSYGSNTYSTIFSTDTVLAIGKSYKTLKVYSNSYINGLSITGYDSLIMFSYYFTSSLFYTYVVAIEPTGVEISPLLIGGYDQLSVKKIGEKIYLYGNVSHMANIYGNYISAFDLAIRPQVNLSKEGFCTSDSIVVSSSVGFGNRWQNGDTSAAYTYLVPNQYLVRFYTFSPLQNCSLSLSKVTYVVPWQQPANNSISYSKNPKCEEDTILLSIGNEPSNGTQLLWSTLDTSNSIRIKEPGNYSLKMSNLHCSRIIGPVQISNYTVPSAPIIIAQDSFFHICADTQILLIASGGSSPYTWSDSTVGNTKYIQKSGIYTLYYKDIHGCRSEVSKPIVMQADTQVEYPLIEFANKMSVCGKNDSLQINALVNNYDSLFWSTGQIGKISIFAKANPIPISVQNRNGKCVRTSYEINIIDDKPSKPIVSASGPLNFCIGGSVNLTSNFSGNNRWSNQSTLKSIVVSQSGTYSVQALFNGCASDQSDSITIQVFNKPDVPILSISGDTIKSNSNETLIWYRNGVQVSVSGLPYYLPGSNGFYSAKARNVHQCISDFSNSINYLKTGLPGTLELNNSINIYPNPTYNLINIQSNFDINSYKIFNMKGEVQVLINCTSERNREISLDNLSEGIYTLGVLSGPYWQYFKVIKLKD